MRHTWLRRLSWLVGLVMGLGLASGALGQTSSDHIARLDARLGLSKPDGDGPFPAVIMVPGCQGFDDPQFRGRYDRFAREFRALGFVVARADYLSAAEARTCDLIMDPAAAARDILVVATHLRTQPFVKPDAINVVGWSFGAGLSLGMLHELQVAQAGPVAAVIAYTPYLTLARPWASSVPVLIMCTLQDTVAPCERIDALLAELPSRESVRYVKFADGLHGFDNPDLKPSSSTTGNPSGYHEPTAAAAWAEVTKFLRR